MMAARFRSVTWVAIAVIPALACYLVTQHVAAERAQLAKVERRIGQTRRAIRDLETELGTRGSMAQIERWNGETFALAAPAAEQFVHDGVQLAGLTALPPLARPAVAATPVPTAAAPAEVRAAVASGAEPVPPAVRDAAFQPVPRAEVRQAGIRAEGHAAVHQAAFSPEPRATVKAVTFKPVRAEAAVVEGQPVLRPAAYVKPSRTRVAPTKVAMLDNGPLDAGVLADIGRIAASERGPRRR